MSRFIIDVPDEADPWIGRAVLEVVEPGSSGHTLSFRVHENAEELRHHRLGVMIRKLISANSTDSKEFARDPN